MKVSDFGKNPKEPTGDDYRKELSQKTEKLNKDFNDFMVSKNPKEKEHFEKSVTDDLSLIHSLTQEVGEKGIRKHEAKLEKDFKEYLKDPSDENYAKIKHDITELRDYLSQ